MIRRLLSDNVSLTYHPGYLALRYLCKSLAPPTRIMTKAQLYANLDTIKIIKEHYPSTFEVEAMLRYSTTPEIADLAVAWGARNFIGQLKHNSTIGNLEMCKYSIPKISSARKCGQVMMGYGGVHMDVCLYAKEVLGFRRFDYMLISAARNNSVEMCRLALEWGADDLTSMMYIAAGNGCHALMRLGAEYFEVNRTYTYGLDFDDLVRSSYGHPECVKLAKRLRRKYVLFF